MAWCPICRYEYKTGITQCADCGAQLVESLEEYDKAYVDQSAGIVDAADYAVNNEIVDFEDEVEYAKIMDEVLDISADEPSQESVGGVFKKASERADEYKSSAYSLILVGVVGMCFLGLCALGIIPFSVADHMKYIFYIVLSLMFVAFIVIGIRSFKSAHDLILKSHDEENVTEGIAILFSQKYSAADIDKMSFDENDCALTDEDKYFKRADTIRALIIDNFGQLEEGFISAQIEVIYSSLYEDL